MTCEYMSQRFLPSWVILGIMSQLGKSACVLMQASGGTELLKTLTELHLGKTFSALRASIDVGE